MSRDEVVTRIGQFCFYDIVICWFLLNPLFCTMRVLEQFGGFYDASVSCPWCIIAHASLIRSFLVSVLIRYFVNFSAFRVMFLTTSIYDNIILGFMPSTSSDIRLR